MLCGSDDRARLIGHRWCMFGRKLPLGASVFSALKIICDA